MVLLSDASTVLLLLIHYVEGTLTGLAVVVLLLLLLPPTSTVAAAVTGAFGVVVTA